MTREQYAEALIPLAARLVANVHDEGPAAILDTLTAVASLPAPDDGTDPAVALTVTLAAMVDPTKTYAELLDWTRHLAAGTIDLVPDPAPRCNPLAVEMCLSGHLPLDRLERHEQEKVVETFMERGVSTAVISVWTDAPPKYIMPIRNRVSERRRHARKRAA